MSTRLRMGLLGLGMMGRHHARVIRAMEGVELVAVADAAGDKNGVASDLDVLPDVEAVIAQGVDMCVVALPTAFHLEAGLALAAAGVHTLLEKPLATDVTEATRLVDAFAAAGVIGCVGHIERYNPALLALRDRLDQGELGDVFQISTRRQGPFPNRIADVGVVMDLATHDIDLTSWVARRSYASVSAFTAHRSGREHEDLLSVSGRLSDGTVVNHIVNWLSPLKERATVVTGDRGAFVADTLNADLTFFENSRVPTEWDAIARFRGVAEGNMTRYAIPKPEPLATELVAFRDAVLGREPAGIVSLSQGLATVTVAQACIHSARTGETVSLETSST